MVTEAQCVCVCWSVCVWKRESFREKKDECARGVCVNTKTGWEWWLCEFRTSNCQLKHHSQTYSLPCEQCTARHPIPHALQCCCVPPAAKWPTIQLFVLSPSPWRQHQHLQKQVELLPVIIAASYATETSLKVALITELYIRVIMVK